jgi:hypothetical protein
VCLLHCYREFVSKEDMLVEINAGFGMGVWNGNYIRAMDRLFIEINGCNAKIVEKCLRISQGKGNR